MNIECILRRDGGTKVDFAAGYKGADVPRTTYHFKPIDPNDPESAHVADVRHTVHRDRLLSIPEGYRLHGSDETVAVVKPVKPSKQAPAAEGEGADGGVDPARVAALGETSVKELKATINTYSPAELRAAAAAEKARTDDKPRSSWLEVIAAHLGE